MATTHNIDTITAEVARRFKAGNYSPTGADGGCLSYGYTVIDGDTVHFEATTDGDIAAIRTVWALTIGDDKAYDYSDTYYTLRGGL